MKLTRQSLTGTLQHNGEIITFAFDHSATGHKLVLNLPPSCSFENVKDWLAALEDPEGTPRSQPHAIFIPKEPADPEEPASPEKADELPPGAWAKSKYAAKHYRVTASTITAWGNKGRIRRLRTARKHGPTGSPIWLYDVSHDRNNVPAPGTWEVAQ